MDWIQICIFLGVNITLIGTMTTVILWAVNRLDTDVKSLESRMEKHERRFESHAQRIDQLYRMFIDLLKETKQQK